jgi:hypothetical protein
VARRFVALSAAVIFSCTSNGPIEQPLAADALTRVVPDADSSTTGLGARGAFAFKAWADKAQPPREGFDENPYHFSNEQARNFLRAVRTLMGLFRACDELHPRSDNTTWEEDLEFTLLPSGSTASVTLVRGGSPPRRGPRERCLLAAVRGWSAPGVTTSPRFFQFPVPRKDWK